MHYLQRLVGVVRQANWPNNHESIGMKGSVFLLPTITPEDAKVAPPVSPPFFGITASHAHRSRYGAAPALLCRFSHARIALGLGAGALPRAQDVRGTVRQGVPPPRPRRGPQLAMALQREADAIPSTKVWASEDW